jgi:hypothetical protein
MKKIRKILPLSFCDIPGIECWLEEQANRGLFPVSINSWVTFTLNGIPGTRFRLEPYGKSGTSPTAEQLELYRSAGWEYAFAVSSVYFLFYTTDPSAVDLYSDNESRGLSLDRWERAAQCARRRKIILWSLLAAALIWAVFFFKNEFDIQPDNLVRLPLLLVHIFNPILLVFIVGQFFVWRQNRRDYRMLRETCKALKEGLPPPLSPGPSKRIVRENILALAMIVPLAILLLGQWFHWFSSSKNIPLDDFDRPYVAIQTLEETPVFPWGDLFEDPTFRDEPRTYYAYTRLSLLAPTWYSVTQDAYSAQAGDRGDVFSPDPENGANRYSPDFDMTYFKLLVPALARPIAEAQLDEYRLVNLSWNYEEVTYADLDFVILADAKDGLWQMAALGKDGRVAVFRYAGVERLGNHLEQLAAMVK